MSTDHVSLGSQRLPRLNDSVDYFKWRSESRTILMQKGPDIYDAVMTATPVPPIGTDEHREWRRYNLTARGILLASMSVEISTAVEHYESAHEIWTHIENSFSQKLRYYLEEIETNFNSLRQDKAAIANYVTKIATMAEQLKLGQVEITWHKRFTVLMKGLRREYAGIRAQIEQDYRRRRETQLLRVLRPDGTFEPLTVVSSAIDEKIEYNAIVDQLKAEEIRLGLHVFGIAQRPRHTVSAFYTQDEGRKSNLQKKKSQQSLKGRKNDSRTGKSQQKSRRPIEEVTCHRCQEKGHYANTCTNPRKERPEQTAMITDLAGSKAALSTTDIGYGGPTDWILDSAATVHVCTNRDLFCDFSNEVTAPIQSGSMTQVEVRGKGTVKVVVDVGKGDLHTIVLQNVYYVPTYAANLISLNLVAKVANISIVGGTLIAKAQGRVVLKGTTRRMLTFLDQPRVELAALTSRGTSSTGGSWHQRLGHPGVARMKEIAHLIPDVAKQLGTRTHKCDVCEVSKSHKQPFGPSLTSTTKPLQLVHSDVVGKMKDTTPEGFQYAVTFVDDYTRLVAVYLLRQKSEVFAAFQTYKSMVENQTNKTIKRFRTDNGGEYVNRDFAMFLANAGIQHETSAPYTPQQNGVSERMNRTLFNITRCLLLQAAAPHYLWGEALLHSAFLNNRMPSKPLAMKSPFQRFFNRDPDLSKLRVFGCRAWAHIPEANRTKLQDRGRATIYIGVSDGSKAFKVLDLHTKTILSTHHAMFDESVFPFVDVRHDVVVADDAIAITVSGDDMEDVDEPAEEATLVSPVPKRARTLAQLDSFSHVTAAADSGAVDSPYLTEEERASGISTPPLPTASQMAYATTTAATATVSNELPTHANVGTVVADLDDEPRTIQQAQQQPDWPKWREAVEKELSSHKTNNTWTLVEAPTSANIIGCRWVFKVKRKADGSVDKYKARLVAQGFTQVHGIDYEETFAPVVKMSTLRMLMIVALQCDMQIYQLDVVTAYLNGELDVDLYMRTPPLPDDLATSAGISRRRVCRLNKSLYGLKQAGRTWYQKADQTLLDIGFKRSNYDSALYFLQRKGEPTTFLTLYVDDVLIFAKEQATSAWIMETLRSKFKMTGGDKVSFILGIQVQHGVGKLHLSQTAHIHRLLTLFGLTQANIVHTPATADELSDGAKLSDADHSLYRTMVGSILYISTCTRPDIAFAVNRLSRHLASPTTKAMIAAKHLLRYLKGTAEHGLLYSKREIAFPTSADWGPILRTYSDADFGGDTATRKSTSGIANTILDMPYSWLSKRQPLVATSTCFAEYIAMAEACKEIIWSRRLLAELGFVFKSPTPLLADNQSAIYLSKDPKDHQRNKHIDIKYHFVREQQLLNTVIAKYVPTAEQLADSFTKALDKNKVYMHREMLNVTELSPPVI